MEALFSQSDICLYSEIDREKTWRISNVSPEILNRLRRWLSTEVLSPAIDLVEILTNHSQTYDEVLAHRLGLSPIEADPSQMEEFAPEVKFDQSSLCTDRTCLLFELHSFNNTPLIRNVTLEELRWVPLGNQDLMFKDRPPRPYYPDLILTRLAPGQEIHLRAYAVLGTGSQHAKWSSVHASYGLETPSFDELKLYPTCSSCEQLRVSLKYDPGLNCYYFTIALIGGLSFEDLDRQLQTRFDWKGLYPPQSIQYLYQK